MVDMHTHVLPAIDDGPEDLESSLALLRKLRESGVTDVICTSHFYPEQRPMEEFTAKRDAALTLVRAALAAEQVDIRLYPAAEVFVKRILLNYDSIDGLCIADTKNILIELPETGVEFDTVVEQLGRIMTAFPVEPVIAHIERVPYLYRHKDKLLELKDAGYRLQLDADCLLSRGFFMKRFAIGAIREGLIDYIGSDTHNLSGRAPNLAEAYAVVAKSCGREAVADLKRNALELLG